jgi:hypothetical protein
MDKIKQTVLLAAVIAGSAQAATVTHAIGVDGTKDSGDAVVYSTWVTSTNDVAGVVDIENFTYDISVSTTAGSLDGTAVNGLDEGDIVTVTISGIDNANVKFDGFVYAGTGGTAGSEGITINALDYTRNGVGIQNGASLATADSGTVSPFPVDADGTIEITAIGSINLQTLEFQFSQVPEPSSTALLGLGGLALILRRRK